MPPRSHAARALTRLRQVRARTAALATAITPEDATVQTMPDVSPTKWHLAHTTWFLEAFVLPRAQKNFRPFHETYAYLFNSYYEGVGERHPRPERGHASRPSLAEVLAYRAHVDRQLEALDPSRLPAELTFALVLAAHHEEQHQELLLTDIRHVYGTQPLAPAYEGPKEQACTAARATRKLRWVASAGGLVEIGRQAEVSDPLDFGFDNESPRHRVFVEPFALASRLVTETEYREFIRDGGYQRAALWLSDGWAAVKARGWEAPMYWKKRSGGSAETAADFTVHDLGGERALDRSAPVSCLSLYEADAYARWAEARLPTEAEWELAIGTNRGAFEQVDDAAWQWTQSAYASYPGFAPFAGDFGEYNGKFMSGQVVLRGGAFTTPPGHARLTYRNFFPPDARWQTSGIRLARAASKPSP